MYNFIIGFLIFGVVASIAMIVYIAFLNSSKVQTVGLLLTISCAIVFVGYLMECTAQTEEQALTACKFGYLGKPISSYLFFIFLCYYCRANVPKWLSTIFIVIQFAISGIVLTCDSHWLYYSSIDYDSTRTFGKLVLGHGPLYYFNIIMAGVYFIFEVTLFIREFRLAKTKIEKAQLLFMFLSIFFTLFGFASFLLFDTKGFDTTVAGYFFSLVTFFILLVKYRLLDTVSLAKDKSLNESKSGLVILDHRDKFIYVNNSANAILDSIEGNKNKKFEILTEYYNKGKNYTLSDNIYSVYIREIEKGGITYGKTIEFNDVTAEANYSNNLEKAVDERTKEIVNMQRKIIMTFANLLEAKDEGTGTHIKETEYFVNEIVEALKKEDKYKNVLTMHGETIVSAAPLHDIGKFSIPDKILLKPEKLTDEEFKVIKTHSKIGADIIEENLRNVETDEYVDIAKNIALYHHERWDGKGYPTGIKGEDIPLEARIMAIADVYNALVSKRCYKDEYPKEKAIEIMLSEKGTHFDPYILDKFIEIIK